jgi:cytochrome c-type biogenesis protein CcmH/NrfG
MATTVKNKLKYLTCCLGLAAMTGTAAVHEHQAETAKVIIETGLPGCRVDLDAGVAGTSGATGNLILLNVDPGDHYIHVRCPGKAEVAYFISPKAAGEVKISPAKDEPTASVETDPTTVADNKIKLQQLVQQAVQLRAQARLDDAVAALREAMKLDPENSDLHREMGITFLLAKEWKRARVEMIEAIRHDQTDADAHNGLGYALEKLGDLDGALKEYRVATQLEPDDPSYRTHYYDALVRIQVRQEAKK